MIQTPPRGILLAALAAVVLHALLFFAVTPSVGEPPSIAAAPVTRYFAQGAGPFPMSENDIRTLKSPILFSLPSGMGFSRELHLNDVSTMLDTLPCPMQTEIFLNVVPSSEIDLDPLVTRDLLVITDREATPGLPSDIFQALEKRPAARRVTVAPELKERLDGGIVLPSELNQEVSKPWEVRASISVSEGGAVRHVFLDEPLESPRLNQQILQLLRGLRFKPGEPLEGHIEIYSPEATIAPPEVSP
ncbi:MAG: hypothetical protein OES84_05835 [Kiritimatiellaceae bacterium]|nr:hypothetical protein [Kiritimatiellaceae bacterium]